MGIDTSDWSIFVIEIDGGCIVRDATLRSEAEIRRFCEEHGYKLISFQKGTNEYCE